MSKKNKAVVPFEDFSTVQDRKAAKAEIGLICKFETVIVARRKSINLSIVEIVNAIVSQGEALQRLAKHEQITFAFVKQIIDSGQFKFPWGTDPREVLETAKRRIAIATNLKGGIKSLEDLAPDARRQLFLHLGLTGIGERGGEGAAPQTGDPFNSCLVDIIRIKSSFEKAEKLAPINTLTQPKCQSFLDDTLWFVDYGDEVTKRLREIAAT